MKKISLLVLVICFVFGLITNLTAQNCDLLYFCVRYDSNLGEIDASDRFTTGNITVMVLLESPIYYTDIVIQLDKYSLTKDDFEYYNDYDFDVSSDMDYIFLNDINFGDPGVYRVFLLDPSGSTITSSLVEIVSDDLQTQDIDLDALIKELELQIDSIDQAENTIFSDDFDDNSNNWLEDENKVRKLKIRNGKYIFEHKEDEGGYFTWKSVPINQDKDFIIETTLQHISGTDDRGYGLVWGMKDIDNYFAFNISNNGFYRIAKSYNDEWQALVDWTESTYLNNYGGINKLTVKKSDASLKFYINDNYVNTINFEHFFGNNIGYVIWRNMRIEIDKLSVSGSGDTEKYEATEEYEFIQRSDDPEKEKIPPPQTFPPDLYIENLKFYEPSYNNALDGLEKGEIQFEIVNRGRGNAFDLDINITPLSSSKNLVFNTITRIDEIPAKGNEIISIPISADIDVQNLVRELRIEIMEGFGFDSDPATISFETQRFAAPDLQIKQIAIDDNEDAEGEGFSYGNSNSIIEPNESIEVTAYVQNFGAGHAIDVKATLLLKTSDKNITCPDEDKVFNLGDIKGGDYQKVEFYFYTSRRYADDNVPLYLQLTETTGKFGKTSDLGLKMGERTKNVVEVQVAKIETTKNLEMRKIEDLIVSSDVDLDIPKSSMDGKNTLAIILGIEEYKYAPKVDFAENDAQIFYQYAKTLFNIPERNIYCRINDGATSGEFNKIFAEDGWIARRIKQDETDVIIYYSGHGAPDTKSKKGYLIPYDIDPNYANTGFSLDEIYSSLAKLKAKSVTVFIDACFSGESRSEEMLLAGTRPIAITIENPILTTENSIVLSASSKEQYSCAYPTKQHGLFTYFLLKGLKGEAKGKNEELDIGELFDYIHINVKETAGYLDKEQTPTFAGSNKDRIFLKY